MKTPHLVQYQGSKRILAPEILKYLPQGCRRIIEPFAGTAAVTIACAVNNKAKQYIINDLNTPLIRLFDLVVNKPEYVVKKYTEIWNGQIKNTVDHYYLIREQFNVSKDPVMFLYLLARCVKGSVRYNSEGVFNQSPDKRRMGTSPPTMKQNIFAISHLLRSKAVFYSKDYKEVLMNAEEGDVIYMDPPYQGVCGDRDSRYFAQIDNNEFIESLDALNRRNIDFIVSYDGSCGERVYGKNLPDFLNMEHVKINAGRSTQSTLLGRKDDTFESLYISSTLYNRMNQKSTSLYFKQNLFESIGNINA